MLQAICLTSSLSLKKNPDKYTALCEAFAQRPANEYYPEYHVNMLKRHLKTIIQKNRRAFVFPYAMTKFHQRELQPYYEQLTLPDVPTNDKAQHNLFLRSKGFTALPQLLAVYPNGSIIDNYGEYIQTLKHLDPLCRVNMPQNIEVSRLQMICPNVARPSDEKNVDVRFRYFKRKVKLNCTFKSKIRSQLVWFFRK